MYLSLNPGFELPQKRQGIMLPAESRKKDYNGEQLQVTPKIDSKATMHAAPAADFRVRFYESPDREPTVPPKGSRPTFFTTLSTMSYKSVQSLERKPHLEEYFSVRVDPPKVTITDYAPATEYERVLRIKNFSMTVKHIIIVPTQTKLFQLVPDLPTSDILISPGLERQIKIIFKAPGITGLQSAAKTLKIGSADSMNASLTTSINTTSTLTAAGATAVASTVGSHDHTSGAATDPSMRLYMDRIIIQVRNGDAITVPFEAYPSGPQLEFDSRVDFGTLVLRQDAAAHLKTLQASSQTPQEKRAKLIREKGWAGKPVTTTYDLDVDRSGFDNIAQWASRFVEIRNVGLRAATFRCLYDRSLPIRITPQTATLGPAPGGVDHSTQPSSCQLKVEYLPSVAGKFTGSIKIELLNELPSIRTKEGSASSSKDGGLQLTANSAENRTSVVLEPSEGQLEANQSVLVKFKFQPNKPKVVYGFKSSQPIAPVKTYQIPMQLRIGASGSDNADKATPGEEPIDILLTGRSCELRASLSASTLTFASIHEHDVTVQHMRVTNMSDELGFRFQFPKIAQFRFVPPSGKLGPLQNINIEVSFRPNQLGIFREMIHCDIYPSDWTPDFPGMASALSTSERIYDKAVIEAIPVLLIASCIPSNQTITGTDGIILHDETAQLIDIESGKRLQNHHIIPFKSTDAEGVRFVVLGKSKDAVKKTPDRIDDQLVKTNPEWDKKNEHRNLYINYIRGSRTDRLKLVRDTYFRNDGVSVDLRSLSAADNLSLIDTENGLVAPEPETNFVWTKPAKSTGTKKPVLALKRVAKLVDNDQIADVDHRKMQSLFQKLCEPVAHKPKLQPSVDPSAKTVSQIPAISPGAVLTASDLANIFASFAEIDVGDITIHSTSKNAINFLNAAPSKVPVHIALKIESVSDMSASDWSISISPNSLVVPYMNVLGFEIGFCSHVVGRFAGKITYIVNGRYHYQIPIKANVVQVALELSTNKVDIDVSIDNLVHLTAGNEPDLNPSSARSEYLPKSSQSTAKQDQVMLPVVERSITVINKGTSEAVFEWVESSLTAGQQPDARTATLPARMQPRLGQKLIDPSLLSVDQVEGYIFVQPARAVVPPRSSVSLTVQFVPCFKTSFEKTVVLNVFDCYNNGRVAAGRLELACHGEVAPSSCVLMTSTKQGPLDLGIIPISLSADGAATPQSMQKLRYYNSLAANVNTPISKIHSGRTTPKGIRVVKIKNSSNNACMFVASVMGKMGDVEVRPHTGIIQGGGGVLELSITASPSKTGVFDETVIVTIIGGARIFKIPIRYEGRETEVEFQSIAAESHTRAIIGSQTVQTYRLCNSGSVYARAIIDLRHLPEFSLKATGVIDNALSDSRNNAVESSNASTRIKVIKSSHEFSALDKESHSKGGESVILDLVFQPRSAVRHLTSIPVKVLGNTRVEFFMHVDTESLPSPIEFSKLDVVFKNKVVYRTIGSLALSHLSSVFKDTITFTNLMATPTTWNTELIPADCFNSTFSLEPSHGSLLKGQSQTVVVTFQPDRPGTFEVSGKLDITCDDIHASFGISLVGNSVEPSLAFDPPEIFLPIVPLGEESMAIFSIINFGCERTEVKPIIPTDTLEHDGSLELFFPEGKLLKSEGEKLTVVVRFVPSANKSQGTKLNMPVSFTSKIQFGEPGKRQFYLHVHGTTDCSHLTLQSYLWLTSKSHVYEEHKDRQGVYYERSTLLPKTDENQRRLKILNGPRPLRTPSGIPLDGSISFEAIDAFWTQIGETLMQWLEEHFASAGSIKPWTGFPAAFLASNGRLLVEYIQSISGKKINGVSSNLTATATSQDDRAKYIYKLYTTVLMHLISFGALLSSVKPEYLLSLDDFKRIMHQKFETMKSETASSMHEQYAEHAAHIETHFAIISKEAWNLPGIKKDEAELEWQTTKTNVYSVHENILLKWAGYHLWKRMGLKRRPKSFSADFNNSVILANLLLAHAPWLKGTHFVGFNLNPTTTDQRLSNAELLKQAFKELYGNNYISNLTPERLCSENQIEFIMLLMFLYQTLPHFLPAATVEFVGALHEKITQTIELSNPSSRTLVYSCELDGDPEYSIAESVYTLGPKSTTRLSVDFDSRFARPAASLLRLKTRKMSLNVSSILVFSLVSTVEAASPSKVFRVEAPMYALPPTVVNVDVTNNFSKRGTFSIQIRQKRAISKHDTKLSVAQKVENFSPPAFRLLTDEITVEAGATANLALNFLPFDLGFHECILYFFDANVGEFMYRVDGKATVPQPIEKFVWTCKSSGTVEKPIRILPLNPHREKAIYACLSSSTEKAAVATHGAKTPKEQRMSSANAIEREAYQLPRRPLHYKVEYTSPYFRGPSEIILKPALEGREKVLAIEQAYTELPISFHPKLPGKYMCKVMLNCMETSDLRVFVIQGMARSDGSRAELEFCTPARQSIVQEIPIVNRTDEDWTIKATLQGQYFACPYSVTARAQSITNCTVIFKPIKACEVAGVLTLLNMQTTQKYIYYLKGFGQNPLPEDTREIECGTHEVIRQKFVVRNYSDQETEFEMETDLPFVVKAERSITVAAGSVGEYTIEFVPKCSGTFMRSITFVNRADDSYVWFTVQVRRPPPSQAIQLSSAIRKAVGVEIALSNPLPKAVEYSVHIEGNGLQGEQSVKLGPFEETVYNIVYAPSKMSFALPLPKPNY
eukprot:jgi/Hompol1/4438/HPOL_001780-RA